MTVTTKQAVTLPDTDLDVIGDKLGDDILTGAVANDPTTKRAARGGAKAVRAPRAWSLGARVD
jgi:hypothetical protein